MLHELNIGDKIKARYVDITLTIKDISLIHMTNWEVMIDITHERDGVTKELKITLNTLRTWFNENDYGWQKV